jgi:hypothetical protein
MGQGLVFGWSIEDMIKQYLLFFVPYGQYHRRVGEVYCNGHGGAERRCYRWPVFFKYQ